MLFGTAYNGGLDQTAPFWEQSDLGTRTCFFCLGLFAGSIRTYSFQNKLFRNIILGIASKFQTVWIQIRRSVGPGVATNCLQRLSVDDKIFMTGKDLTSIGI